MRLAIVVPLVVGVAGVACSPLPEPVLPPTTLVTIRSVEVRSPLGMVVAASREPAEVAVAVLEGGGTAMDAAVAGAFALGSADPAASGLGGATQILLRLADGRIVAIDGSATVPRLLDRERPAATLRALREKGVDDSVGWEFVAVPGTVAALAHLAQRYGTRPWAELLAPAIELAESGVELTVSDVAAIEFYESSIKLGGLLHFWLLEGGEKIPEPGTRTCNQELAAALRAIAREGPGAFYHGAIASQIEADMVRYGGFVRRADLALYRVVEREAWRTTYRDVEVIGFPPPGAGGVVLEALNILEQFAPATICTAGVPRIHLLAESSHVAFLDNSRSCLDPDDPRLSRPPAHLSKAFAAERAKLLRLGRPLTRDDLGSAPLNPWSVGGTTPLVVADRFGNVVSLSQTLGRYFGAKVLSPSLGFPYNSLLESFDTRHQEDTKPGGRLPLLMAPTLVLRDGKVFLALAASGSAKVPSTVAQMISNVVDCGLGPAAATDRPRAMWQIRWDGTGPFVEVREEITAAHVEALKKLGYGFVGEVVYPAPRRESGRLGITSLLMVDPTDGSFVGVADPRRWACAMAPRI